MEKRGKGNPFGVREKKASIILIRRQRVQVVENKGESRHPCQKDRWPWDQKGEDARSTGSLRKKRVLLDEKGEVRDEEYVQGLSLRKFEVNIGEIENARTNARGKIDLEGGTRIATRGSSVQY